MIIDYPAVKEVAAKHGATPAQAVIAWGAHRGYIVIPKSVHKGMFDRSACVSTRCSVKRRSHRGELQTDRAFSRGLRVHRVNWDQPPPAIQHSSQL